MQLNTFICSHCAGAGLRLDSEGVVVCEFCGTANDIDGTVCHNCEWVNTNQTESCAQCGLGLFRTCPACQTRNWGGATACAQCGEALDTLAYMTSRLQKADAGQRLTSQQRFARDIKAEEARAAERRTAHFRDMEDRRRKGVLEATARRAARERQVMTMLIGLVLVVIVLLTIFAFYQYLGR
jgi:hypothetical protein